MGRPYVDYKNKMVGQRVDYDNAYWYQCVDLFKDYCSKVLGYAYGHTGSAKEIWINKNYIFRDDRHRIKGMTDLMQWDVICSTNGLNGHIAIVDHILWDIPYVLEQNGSGVNPWSWTGDNAIRVHPYPRSFWAGVWRCKKIEDNLAIEQKFIADKLKKKLTAADKKNTLDYQATLIYKL